MTPANPEVLLGAGFLTCTQEQALAQLPRFQCPPPGNCSLPLSFVNNNVCDCPGTCADEKDWDCDTRACPDVCGMKNRNCFDLYFACPHSNCTIGIYQLNNGNCDCPTCADENNFTCDTCVSGCPTNQTCHPDFFYPCEYRIFECPNSFGGCFIASSSLNDNFCDCPDCSDEEGWDCSNCSSGCAFCRGTSPEIVTQTERDENQQKAINCFGQQFNLNFPVQCPGYPAHPGSPAMKLGCAINYTALNDNNCDCPSCSCGVF